MCDHHDHDQSRRDLLKLAGALGLVGLAGPALAANDRPIGAMVPGQGWVPADAAACAGDGTPLQFIPRTAPDPDPLTDELKKYPRCPSVVSRLFPLASFPMPKASRVPFDKSSGRT